MWFYYFSVSGGGNIIFKKGLLTSMKARKIFKMNIFRQNPLDILNDVEGFDLLFSYEIKVPMM